MIDMELVALGCGVSDLTTWMLIRADKVWRRKHEKEIVELYYETLIECGAKFGTCVNKESYPLEQCWKDYAYEGMGRMAFYFAQIPPYFNHHVTVDLEDAIADFITQHGVTVENVAPTSPF